MENLAKVCKQCGELKPIDSYRMYYNDSKKHYAYCKDCERVNSRFKYLNKKPEENKEELQEIISWYAYLKSVGFKCPGATRSATLKMPRKMSQPSTLEDWLTKDLQEFTPEHLQDVVYEDLKRRYRPVQYIDASTLLPVFDDTYKDTLNAILKRFDEYEEELA